MWTPRVSITYPEKRERDEERERNAPLLTAKAPEIELLMSIHTIIRLNICTPPPDMYNINP
jgi:hypothetical protein